jgi:hypothetical protein
MRLLHASLAAVALLASATAGHAQTAYDYPWCAVYADPDAGGAQSCYYTTYAQCMQTISGIGGYCIASPYYGHGPHQRPQRAYRQY